MPPEQIQNTESINTVKILVKKIIKSVAILFTIFLTIGIVSRVNDLAGHLLSEVFLFGVIFFFVGRYYMRKRKENLNQVKQEEALKSIEVPVERVYTDEERALFRPKWVKYIGAFNFVLFIIYGGAGLFGLFGLLVGSLFAGLVSGLFLALTELFIFILFILFIEKSHTFAFRKEHETNFTKYKKSTLFYPLLFLIIADSLVYLVLHVHLILLPIELISESLHFYFLAK